jgi:hypothetical protein
VISRADTADRALAGPKCLTVKFKAIEERELGRRLRGIG